MESSVHHDGLSKILPDSFMDREKALRIAIIEDEIPAYNRLTKLLKEITQDKIEVVTHLDSVSDTRKWLSEGLQIDLLFMDIHLGDGSAFDILNESMINCPLIFTTAYNQYMLDAFRTNGLSYLLKPINKPELIGALIKFNQLAGFFKSRNGDNSSVSKEYKKRFIIRYGKHISTVNVEDIAYFFSTHKATCLRTFSGQTYTIDSNLDALESLLNPMLFFRVNRQYLTHIQAIEEMVTYSKGRVCLKLQYIAGKEIVVSSEKSSKFKFWLDGEINQ
ncbi:MAG TPA: LytTR family DNA-binding domain-containing protein [Edaphocola sp.]|nr:LytTR family DNA-binding domain-containing protein [Edaphocola sp.]